MTTPTNDRLCVLILAAGQSSRMRGRDKLLEKVAGEPLIRRQARIARAVSPWVLVAVPALDHPRVAALDGLDVEVRAFAGSKEGMGGTLREGIADLSSCDKALILLGDLPELEVSDLRCILQAATDYPDHLIWRGVTSDGAPGHPILFDAATFHAFETLSGDNGARDIVRRFRDRTHLVPLPGQRARRDLDTPEDWVAWRAEREGLRSGDP